jgi:hypothetical protein
VCPGGQKHKISSEYQRNMVCQTVGIDGWLDWLGENEPQLLGAQFIALPAILRSEYDIQRWRRQAVAAAAEMRTHYRLFQHNSDMGEVALDECFPMSTARQNCLRPSKCPYLDLCFGPADPEDREQFVERTFNHPQEAELVQIGQPVGVR